MDESETEPPPPTARCVGTVYAGPAVQEGAFREEEDKMAQRGGRWMRPRPDWGLAVDRTARGSPRGCNGDTSLAFRVWTPSGSLRRARNGTDAFEFTKGGLWKSRLYDGFD
jgi:hypothetical protein